MIRKTLHASAGGYVLKSDVGSSPRASLEAVSRGRCHLRRQESGKPANEYSPQAETPKQLPPPRLTKRELEVIQLLSLGRSSKEIGTELNISVRTVETHRANMMRKLNVHSVTELLHHARSHKLIEFDDTA
jgi:two-component system secretion response regulator SsrB